MRWNAKIFICLIFVSTCVHAQQNGYSLVKGVVFDSISHHPIESTSIAVYLASDSSLVGYTISNRKGQFIVTGIPLNVVCKLVVSAGEYESFSVSFVLSFKNKEKQFDTIQLLKVYKELKMVTITALRPPIAIKQDTLEFNVSAFKTMPNAMVEDLLKQLPGVEIDKEGNITINGKKVSKVMLDGREFFGGDPKIAIKNLPKDIIDKLQVMNNKNHEAQFNKTTEGNEDLAINLTLKKEVQKGWIGRAGAGYGSGERYEGNAMINYFNGSKQLNFIGTINNTNRGSASGNEFNISSPASTLDGAGGGLTRTASGGVNFSNDLASQFKLNGSYFFTRKHTDNFSRLQRKNFLPDTAFYYNADNRSGNGFTNHHLSINAEYGIDTFTKLHINSYVTSNISDALIANNASSTGLGGQLINTSENSYSSKGSGKGISSKLFFSHRFTKSGRGITLGLNYNYNNLYSANDNIGQIDYYKFAAVDSSDPVNQRSHMKNSGNIVSFTVTYAEPINKYLTALFRYNYNRHKDLSSKVANRFNSLTGKYDVEDSAYSNVFQNVTSAHNPEVTFSLNKNKYQASIGSVVQFLQQDNFSLTTNALWHRHYHNFMPSANLSFNFSKTGNIALFYNGHSKQPSVQQLQPVPDNSNPLSIQLGNPDLRPAFFHNVNIQFRGLKASNYWFTGLNFNLTKNGIMYETWFDETGKQVSRPANINGNYGVSGNLQYSRTWKDKDVVLTMNLGSNGYFNRTNSFVNKVHVTSDAYTLSQSVGLNFMYKQLLSVMPSFTILYNKTKYSAQQAQNADFNTKTFSVSAFWNYPKWLIVENNLQHNYNSEIASGFKKHITVWSAALNCLMFKKQQGVLRLAVYDILKQNAGVSRSITQTYIEDRQTQVLQQYVLLSFIYNLKKLKTE